MSPLMSLCLVFFLFSFIHAAPLDPRTVFAPPILSPTAKSVWTVGAVETVTWNASGIPAGVTGMIKLGFLTSESENLSVTLASGFNLTDEKVNITVPAVVTRTNYIIVLFGDSGNASPEFTIQGLSAPASASGTTSASPPTGTSSINTPTSGKGSVSATPSPPIATASSSAPVSTATAPPSSAPGSSSSAPGSSSLAPGFSSSSAVTSPSPSPSNNAGWSMNKLTTYRVMVVPAALLLVL
ncbi:hypothetical protein C8R44DRAFT_697636 [Mycena epipterygia]|nr:hypothetical protein C8R44DRAFT_697636 [Mycena epipterygia]